MKKYKAQFTVCEATFRMVTGAEMAVVFSSNFLLRARRRGYDKSQTDMKNALFNVFGLSVSIASISYFENSKTDKPVIADDATREHYVAILDMWEQGETPEVSK